MDKSLKLLAFTDISKWNKQQLGSSLFAALLLGFFFFSHSIGLKHKCYLHESSCHALSAIVEV